MKTTLRISITLAILTVLAACTDSELEHRLAGRWVAEMGPVQVDGNTVNGSITLILNADNLTDTLIVNAPGGKGMLDTYSFAGTWGAVDKELTLNLSNKLLQDHADRTSAKIDSISEMREKASQDDPEFDEKLYDTSQEQAELILIETLRKNVGCRSTMTIVEHSDSVLVLGDNSSTIRFVRQ